MKKYSLKILLAILLLSMSAWGQSDCAQDFQDISLKCILNSEKKFSTTPILLSKVEIGSIYFYKTSSGETGKIKVLSVSKKTKKECSIAIDALTFAPDGTAFSPYGSLSISSDNNNWLPDKLYLNKDGSSALVLEKISQEQSKALKLKDESKSDVTCLIIPSAGTEYVLFSKGVKPETQLEAKNSKLLNAALVLIFVAIFLIVRVFIEEQDAYKAQETMNEVESTKNNNDPLFLKVTKPFYKRYFLPIIQSSRYRQSFKTKYRQKIANAGLSKQMTSEEFVALKMFMILGGPFAFLVVRYIFEADWSLYLTPFMGVFGFIYPDVWISGMIKKRSSEVLMAMPFIVDMLALSVEAGLDFMAAIQRVIEKAPRSALVDEFETLIKETKIGSSRAEGLRQLSWRVNVIEINSFCATLIAADSVGASIGPLLKQLSSEMRVKRTARAEQQGATAATKILIPMIFFILPAVLVAIFAPMVLKMISGKL